TVEWRLRRHPRQNSRSARAIVMLETPPMSKPREQGTVRRRFQHARDVRPRRISGRERPSQIIEGAFPAYVGRQERTAYQLMRKCVADRTAVFLTLSGAMTPAGLHQSCLIPLIERGIIDCITTTGANLYHDAHR